MCGFAAALHTRALTRVRALDKATRQPRIGYRGIAERSEEVVKIEHDRRRRELVGVLGAVPLGTMLRASPAVAQAAIVQPAKKTKAGFLARARALRNQAVKEGDQAYGAVVVRDGIIVGEGRN